jgi:hypothetical protein
MFGKLFRQNKSVDIDRLIFDIAEYKRTADYETFYTLIGGRVFFVRVDPASTKGIPQGVPHKIKATDSLRLTGLAKIQGLTLLPLFTSAEDKRLQGSYAEIEGLEALRMALKTSGIDGVLFQNKEQSWVALKMDEIRHVLAASESQP